VALAAAALAAWPASYAAANVIGYDFEALNGDGSAANVLNVNPLVGKGNFNANTGISQQSSAAARFGTYSANISDITAGQGSANMTMYANLTATSTLTVMAQVNLDSPDWANERVLIENNVNNGYDGLISAGQYRLAVNGTTGQAWVDIYDPSATYGYDPLGGAQGNFDQLATPTGLFSVGNWAHVAMTFNNGVVDLYVNGSLEATHDFSAVSTSIGNTDYALIGNSNDGSRYLKGYMDDYYYNDTAALSAHDVAFYSTHTLTDAVPEPASLGLLAAGGLLLIRRRRKL
jgi:hypothetical protein